MAIYSIATLMETFYSNVIKTRILGLFLFLQNIAEFIQPLQLLNVIIN